MSYRFSFLFSLLVLFSACERDMQNVAHEDVAMEESYEPDVMAGNSDELQSNGIPVQNLHLIKEADIKYETKNLEESAQAINALTARLGGYISSEKANQNGYRKEILYTLRIPSAQFEKAMAGIGEGVQHFDRREIKTRDVSEEYVDVESRIKSAQEIEARLLKLLDRAKNVEEILQVEQKLGQVRSEIERAQGRMKYLKDRIALSSIEVHIYQELEKEVIDTDEPNRFVIAIKDGWTGFTAFVLILIRLWPLMILTALFIFAFKRFRKKTVK
ncbi:DUF4349 domain-containing protein [Croceimicrobium sp.]|uniref:DUF4349 domain-containing protein n=1 Tax=Croceimicrobium sp. TaxID=2828340 RepID=UPI003BA8B0E1